MGYKRGKYDQVKQRIPEIMLWRRRDGLTEKDIAAKLGISQATIENYKNRYPEFREAMLQAKEAVVSDVFAALLKRAKGYEYEEVKVYTRKEAGENGMKDVTYTEKVRKHEPPNVAACSLILKNLDRQHDWSDNPGMLAIKREEQALRRQMAEADKW